MIKTERIDGYEIRRTVGLVGVVEGGDGQVFGMGMDRGADAIDA